MPRRVALLVCSKIIFWETYTERSLECVEPQGTIVAPLPPKPVSTPHLDRRVIHRSFALVALYPDQKRLLTNIWKPFLGTNLLQVSIGSGFGARKGLKPFTPPTDDDLDHLDHLDAI